MLEVYLLYDMLTNNCWSYVNVGANGKKDKCYVTIVLQYKSRRGVACSRVHTEIQQVEV